MPVEVLFNRFKLSLSLAGASWEHVFLRLFSLTCDSRLQLFHSLQLIVIVICADRSTPTVELWGLCRMRFPKRTFPQCVCVYMCVTKIVSKCCTTPGAPSPRGTIAVYPKKRTMKTIKLVGHLNPFCAVPQLVLIELK